jgi:hypothetical protein
MSTIVIMPGGFHPFHAGHMSLYNAARKAFPDAEVYVAATNSQEERPFPFAVKEKLAKVAGVEPGHFIQVKSPFQSKEIMQHYNPEQDVLIFVRSEKDRNESPKPGGMKKDGTPAYFQPYDPDNLQPFGKHAYFAYLPTVKFGPGITSATEIRKAWPTLDERRKTAMVMSLYPATQKNPKLANIVMRMLDQVMGGQVAEAINDADRVSKGKPTSDNVRRKYWDKTVGTILGGKSSDSEKKKAWDRYQKIGKVTDPELFKEQGVAEGSDSGWIGNPAKWKEAVLQAYGPDVVFKNYTHPGQPGKRSVHAFNTNNKIVGVYQRHNKMGMVQPNLQGVAEGSIADKIKGAAKSVKRASQGWGVGAAPDMITPAGAVSAFKNMDGQRLANFVASRKDQSKPRKDSAGAFVDKVIDREMKQRGYGRVADKDDQGVAEGAPIVVAQAPIDVRNPKKAPQPYRNQGDIVPPTKPPSTEKRGVKGRPGQRPMPNVSESNLAESADYIDEK